MKRLSIIIFLTNPVQTLFNASTSVREGSKVLRQQGCEAFGEEVRQVFIKRKAVVPFDWNDRPSFIC